MKKRTVGLFAAILFAFSGILVRLYDLTDEELRQAAQSQSTVRVTVASARGTIYDRELVPLTNGETEYRASVAPTPEAIATLASVLPDEDWEPLYEQLQNGKPVVSVMGDTPSLSTGISLFTVPIRYSQAMSATHVIGYLGDDGIHGATGIEKALDDELLAMGGELTVTYETDGRGRVLSGGDVVVENTLANAKAGVVLTLDARIQGIVEARGTALLEKGAVVVLDPANGDVLAMASFPTFQPCQLASYLEAENSPLFNRATAAYNCGSVFKIVSAAAALEQQISLTQTFYCAGSLPVGANVIKCHHILGHGWQDLTAGFVNSCNPYFIQLIQQVKGRPLYRLASAMSFDSALTLTAGYTTASAVFPTEEELNQATALANVSFGQGELSATPLHIAQMTASVVNGGTVVPSRLVLGRVDKEGRFTAAETEPPVRLYSKNTAARLREMMCKAVLSGTGADARPSVGSAGGKTGTAETGWVLEDGTTMVQSWFTGFYPADDPDYVITVLSEDAGRSKKNASPVFKAICESLANLQDGS